MGNEPDLRVYFAAERTMLAWVRTGLALMGFGFVVARFGLFLREITVARGGLPVGGSGSLWAGTVLVMLGVVTNLYAASAHLKFQRKYNAGEQIQTSSSFGIVLATLLAGVGFAMGVYLVFRS